MIKISHEVPKALLEWSLDVNDYDYILPYFYKRSSDYAAFYQTAKSNGRFSILDNGLFEGETYSNLELVCLINELKPDIFIVPDEWNNSDATYKHAEKWSDLSNKLNLDTDLMIVLQGERFEEMFQLLYKCYQLGYRHFAVNHSSKAYDSHFQHNNPDVSKMMGRINFINYIQRRSTIPEECYFHLLGCTLPQEFMYYKGYDFIKSVDTSNPIILGLENILYSQFGQLVKPDLKMAHYFNWERSNLGGDEIGDLEMDTIQKNINTFKQMFL